MNGVNPALFLLFEKLDNPGVISRIRGGISSYSWKSAPHLLLRVVLVVVPCCLISAGGADVVVLLP